MLAQKVVVADLWAGQAVLPPDEVQLLVLVVQDGCAAYSELQSDNLVDGLHDSCPQHHSDDCTEAIPAHRWQQQATLPRRLQNL